MIGFAIGTLSLLGLMGMMGHHRRKAWAHHHAGWGHHGWHGHPGWHHDSDERPRGPGRWFRGDGFSRAAGEVFKRKLRLDDDQEGIVDHALADARSAVKELLDELKDTRPAFAGAFRGDKVDDAAIASVFARHDDAVARARRELVSALKQVHAVLDEDQRRQATEWLGSGPTEWV